MFRPSLRVMAGAASAAAVVALAACSSSGSSSSATGSTATASNAAAGSGMPTVTMMVGGIDKQIYLPYQLAQDLGFYKKYGVNMQLSTEQNGGVGAETVDAPDAETECPVGVDTQASRLLVLNR